ncbi:MAG TPA: glycoside hydrolase family 38 C-terminal domain-containing protein [Anaerolineales bacterium]|jgi:alpha-mannosidase|nr:glycoside hydrolase family 38 C-terminal domain-containing protein [Anaerolineales bacterium]HQX15046.1 glycoside hydrolase family 38 C-terminal domain-containing protein [Anaerolineales bacterium]
MKSFRRTLMSALIGGAILFGCARPAPRPEETREPLGNFDPETQSLIARAERVVFLIPFSHWDTDWHDSFEAYSKKADQNILTAIEIAKDNPRYRYTLEQVLFVQHFWETHPASRADLVSLVQNRQLTFSWGGITQPETSLVAPSIQVRNLKFGEAWIAETFGAEYVPRSAWQSDAFGNSAAFPSYLSQLDIPYLFIGRHQGRCDPDYENCAPLPPAFYWTSPASSQGRVLVAYMSYYAAWNDLYRDDDPSVQISKLHKTIEEEFKTTDSNFLLMQVGFDLSNPRTDLLEFVDRWNAEDKDTVLVVSDADSAFQYLATQPLPEITVDMNPIWQAFYNTRPFAKIADKESEYYLTAADKFGLLIDAPKSSAWDLAAFNAHYDNISGVGFDWVWEQSQRPRYEQTLATAKDDLANILANISARVPAPVIVFNPTSWSRSEVVEITGEFTDTSSLPAPIQQIDSNTIAFLAQDIPSLGYVGLNSGQETIDHPAHVLQADANRVTLENGLVSVTIDGDHGGTFSSLMLTNESDAPRELLDGFGDDVTYWADTGDVYGASFGNVIARESDVSAELTVLASGPLIARVQAIFTLGGQQVVKIVTMRADDPLVEVELEMSALPDSTAIAHTSTILDTDMRTDDLGFGAFNHKIDARPIESGDVTYRREIFYPIMYWSDVSKDDVGLTLITHGLQGVSGGDQRGVMLVRQAAGDNESVSDPGVHRLRYAYFPHSGTAEDAKPWINAYEFNQPLIMAWKTDQAVNVELPFEGEVRIRELENLEGGSPLPLVFSLLSTRDAIVADLYQEGDQVMAVVLDYDPMNGGMIQVGEQTIALPQGVFTLMQLPLGIPLQK